MKMKTTSDYWYIAVIAIIFLLVLFILYLFFSRKSSKPRGLPCTKQNCPKDQYCTSSGYCLLGTPETVGNICVKNNDCEYGYRCISKYCVPYSPLPISSLPSNFYLITTFGSDSTPYYLDPQNSIITTNIPEGSFSYDYVNQILSIAATSMVNVNSNGYLTLSTTGYPLSLSVLNNTIEINHPCGSILSYKETQGNREVFFPSTGQANCPNTYQNVLGPVPLSFTVRPVNKTILSSEYF
ncbi:hypothetical protein BH23THE1_BH23THE1_33540 [soil metagenome]